MDVLRVIAVGVVGLWSSNCFLFLSKVQIRQMTYQFKCAGKMVDFEILTLCVSLNSSQVCTYFCKDLLVRYCLYLVKKSIPSRHPFLN